MVDTVVIGTNPLSFEGPPWSTGTLGVKVDPLTEAIKALAERLNQECEARRALEVRVQAVDSRAEQAQATARTVANAMSDPSAADAGGAAAEGGAAPRRSVVRRSVLAPAVPADAVAVGGDGAGGDSAGSGAGAGGAEAAEVAEGLDEELEVNPLLLRLELAEQDLAHYKKQQEMQTQAADELANLRIEGLRRELQGRATAEDLAQREANTLQEAKKLIAAEARAVSAADTEKLHAMLTRLHAGLEDRLRLFEARLSTLTATSLPGSRAGRRTPGSAGGAGSALPPLTGVNEDEVVPPGSALGPAAGARGSLLGGLDGPGLGFGGGLGSDAEDRVKGLEAKFADLSAQIQELKASGALPAVATSVAGAALVADASSAPGNAGGVAGGQAQPQSTQPQSTQPQPAQVDPALEGRLHAIEAQLRQMLQQRAAADATTPAAAASGTASTAGAAGAAPTGSGGDVAASVAQSLAAVDLGPLQERMRQVEARLELLSGHAAVARSEQAAAVGGGGAGAPVADQAAPSLSQGASAGTAAPSAQEVAGQASALLEPRLAQLEARFEELARRPPAATAAAAAPPAPSAATAAPAAQAAAPVPAPAPAVVAPVGAPASAAADSRVEERLNLFDVRLGELSGRLNALQASHRLGGRAPLGASGSTGSAAGGHGGGAAAGAGAAGVESAVPAAGSSPPRGDDPSLDPLNAGTGSIGEVPEASLSLPSARSLDGQSQAWRDEFAAWVEGEFGQLRAELAEVAALAREQPAVIAGSGDTGASPNMGATGGAGPDAGSGSSGAAAATGSGAGSSEDNGRVEQRLSRLRRDRSGSIRGGGSAGARGAGSDRGPKGAGVGSERTPSKGGVAGVDLNASAMARLKDSLFAQLQEDMDRRFKAGAARAAGSPMPMEGGNILAVSASLGKAQSKGREDFAEGAGSRGSPDLFDRMAPGSRGGHGGASHQAAGGEQAAGGGQDFDDGELLDRAGLDKVIRDIFQKEYASMRHPDGADLREELMQVRAELLGLIAESSAGGGLGAGLDLEGGLGDVDLGAEGPFDPLPRDGAAGASGPVGAAGAAGTDGADGANGAEVLAADGGPAAAGEGAVAEGSEGTEEGAVGGAAVAAGDAGAAGAAGASGAAGAVGEPGAAGVVVGDAEVRQLLLRVRQELQPYIEQQKVVFARLAANNSKGQKIQMDATLNSITQRLSNLEEGLVAVRRSSLPGAAVAAQAPAAAAQGQQPASGDEAGGSGPGGQGKGDVGSLGVLRNKVRQLEQRLVAVEKRPPSPGAAAVAAEPAVAKTAPNPNASPPRVPRGNSPMQSLADFTSDSLHRELRKVKDRLEQVEQSVGGGPGAASKDGGPSLLQLLNGLQSASDERAEDERREVENLFRALRGLQKDHERTMAKVGDMEDGLSSLKARTEKVLPQLLAAIEDINQQMQGLHGAAVAAQAAAPAAEAGSDDEGRDRAKARRSSSPQLDALRVFIDSSNVPAPFASLDALEKAVQAAEDGTGGKMKDLRQELLEALAGKADENALRKLAAQLEAHLREIRTMVQNVMTAQLHDSSVENAALVRLPLLPGRCVSCDKRVDLQYDKVSPYEKQAVPPTGWPRRDQPSRLVPSPGPVGSGAGAAARGLAAAVRRDPSLPGVDNARGPDSALR